MGNKVRVFLNERFENKFISKVLDFLFGFKFFKMKSDCRSDTFSAWNFVDGVGSVTGRFPKYSITLTGFLCMQSHAVCHHKSRIKTHTKLTYELRAVFEFLIHLLKFFRSRLCNGSDVFNNFIKVHSNTSINNLQSFEFCVWN